MIGRIKVGNPQLKIDYNNNYEITFPVNYESKFAVKQIMNDLQKNGKELSLTVDYQKKHRTLNQNALMWALLTEWAYFLNGGRKGGITEEDLYIQVLHKYGQVKFILIKEEAVESLKNDYKDIVVINKGLKYKGELYAEVKCIIGSSNEVYDTKRMAELIDGILDDMTEAGIESANKRAMEEEWREYYGNKLQ